MIASINLELRSIVYCDMNAETISIEEENDDRVKKNSAKINKISPFKKKKNKIR